MERPTDSARKAPAVVRIGPAGFSYDDWNGPVYPPGLPRRFSRLGWLARFFDLMELNVSFYRVPTAIMAARWAREVEAHPDFVFTAKLHRSLTHTPRELDAEVLKATREFLRPLVDADRLSMLLAQFPWSFRANEASLDYVARLRDVLQPFPLALEVRHGGWGRDEIQDRLAQLELCTVSVDQPLIGDSLLPLRPRPHPLAYVRLHGRNDAAWFDAKAGRDARYDYLYSTPQLQDWASRIQSISHDAQQVHVVTNNHFRGQAVANALELRALLGLPLPEVPHGTWQAFPGLRQAAHAQGLEPMVVGPETAPEEPSQGDLFA